MFPNILETRKFRKGDQMETFFSQKGDQKETNFQQKGDLYNIFFRFPEIAKITEIKYSIVGLKNQYYIEIMYNCGTLIICMQ